MDRIEHKKSAKRFIRARTRQSKDGGAWKVEHAENLRAHFHILIQTHRKPTKEEVQRTAGEKLKDIKISEIPPEQIRNVAAYLVKPGDPKDREGRERKSPATPNPANLNPVTRAHCGRMSGCFGSWHANSTHNRAGKTAPDTRPPRPLNATRKCKPSNAAETARAIKNKNRQNDT